MDKTTFEISSDGEICAVSRAPILIKNDLMKRFTVESPIKVAGLFDASMFDGAIGRVGACFSTKVSTFTIPVGQLPMCVPFVMNDAKMLVPNFGAPIQEATINLKWTVSVVPSMRVFLLITIQREDITSGNGYINNSDIFLLAMDTAGKTYRLPTSNAYEDCRLCSGAYESRGTTMMDSLLKGWRQFQVSRWQSDLRDRGGTNTMANSMKMFRYKPNDKDGFTQLAPDGADWRVLCTKTSLEWISNTIVL